MAGDDAAALPGANPQGREGLDDPCRRRRGPDAAQPIDPCRDGGGRQPFPADGTSGPGARGDLRDGNGLRRIEAKSSSFDKLRMRFSTATACTMVLILSLSKDEDHAPGLF